MYNIDNYIIYRNEVCKIREIVCSNDKMYEIEYKKLLEEGSQESLIKIIKTTYLRNKNRIDSKRKISDKDNKYFKKSEGLLYSEFSVSLNISYDEAKNYIIKAQEKINK